MKVSACLPTRGDVDMQPILDSLPPDWERVVWDNGRGRATILGSEVAFDPDWSELRVPDLSVYGRYEAIKYASHDLIYVQDDDVIVSDPQAIVDAWEEHALELGEIDRVCTDRHVVCNMPQEFRPHYTDSALVGFGAVFHREAPARAFNRWKRAFFTDAEFHHDVMQAAALTPDPLFYRTCDVVFTTLTPRVLVDVPKENLPYASDDNRMWKQPNHVAERTRMLKMAREVRDGA